MIHLKSWDEHVWDEHYGTDKQTNGHKYTVHESCKFFLDSIINSDQPGAGYNVPFRLILPP